MKKTLFLYVLLCFLMMTVMANPVFAIAKVDDRQIVEWEEDGIDINHTTVIEKINNYIDEKVDKTIFASLHIDREEDPKGKIVPSFTEEPSESVKSELNALTEGTVELIFRVVAYTEEELMKKQAEIDKAVFENKVFEDKGIEVYHTGVNVITNKLEIGIAPFTEENVKFVRDYFNDEKIDVVEGLKIQLLTSENKDASDEASEKLEEENNNFFKKIIDWFRNLFKSIKG